MLHIIDNLLPGSALQDLRGGPGRAGQQGAFSQRGTGLGSLLGASGRGESDAQAAIGQLLLIANAGGGEALPFLSFLFPPQF